jgi:hypothetical protein
VDDEPGTRLPALEPRTATDPSRRSWSPLPATGRAAVWKVRSRREGCPRRGDSYGWTRPGPALLQSSAAAAAPGSAESGDCGTGVSGSSGRAVPRPSRRALPQRRLWPAPCQPRHVACRPSNRLPPREVLAGSGKSCAAAPVKRARDGTNEWKGVCRG